MRRHTSEGSAHSYDKSKGMGAANRGRHSDARVDELIQKGLATVDADARGKLLAEATEIAVGENFGVIPIHYRVSTWASTRRDTSISRVRMSVRTLWV